MYPPPPAAAYPGGPHVAPPSADYPMKDGHGYPQNPASVESKAKGDGFWRGWYVKSFMFSSFCVYIISNCLSTDTKLLLLLLFLKVTTTLLGFFQKFLGVVLDFMIICEYVEMERTDAFDFRFVVVLACVAAAFWMLASEDSEKECLICCMEK